MRTTVSWLALALLGLAIAAAVALAASSLVSQKIGLASEPLDAGRSLAPAAEAHRAPVPQRGTDASTHTAPPATSGAPPSTSAPAPATTAAPPATSSSSGESDGGGGPDD